MRKGIFWFPVAKFRAMAGSFWPSARRELEIEAIIKEDPFHEHGLAEFRIIQFRASQRAADIPARIA